MPEPQEERLDKLRAALQAEPDRMAKFTDRHAELSRLIARLQVKAELGDDVRAQLDAAVEERSDLAVDISLNGRRAQALQAELAEAEATVSQARAKAEAAARARWEPRLRARLPALEKAALDAMQRLMAARSLLDGIPAGMLDAGLMMKKMAYYEGTLPVERMKQEFMQDGAPVTKSTKEQ
jgi:small-conductance mechanosensitive channel